MSNCSFFLLFFNFWQFIFCFIYFFVFPLFFAKRFPYLFSFPFYLFFCPTVHLFFYPFFFHFFLEFQNEKIHNTFPSPFPFYYFVTILSTFFNSLWFIYLFSKRENSQLFFCDNFIYIIVQLVILRIFIYFQSEKYTLVPSHQSYFLIQHFPPLELQVNHCMVSVHALLFIFLFIYIGWDNDVLRTGNKSSSIISSHVFLFILRLYQYTTR